MVKTRRIKVLFISGTRPEVIKIAPIYLLAKTNRNFEVNLINTGQHKELADEMTNLFGIKPDFDLSIMRKNQTPSSSVSLIISKVDALLSKIRPDLVLVQGDTSTAYSGAVAAYLNKIPVAHIEAGLRTDDLYSPYPEEGYRQMISRIATFNFCPTEKAKQNLLSESVKSDKIYVTGNTIIDALNLIIETKNFQTKVDPEIKKLIGRSPQNILVTQHRRENFGDKHTNILLAIRDVTDKFPESQVIFPVHPNPNIQAMVHELLKDCPRIKLVRPLSYPSLLYTMMNSKLVITDSGGIQEEAPTFNVPVLVTRDQTERPEGITSGVSFLVGSDTRLISILSSIILSDRLNHKKVVNPFGDGKAAQRIVDILEKTI